MPAHQHAGSGGGGSSTGPSLRYTMPDLMFVDFLSRCLVWDPSKRMTPSDALAHPWLRRKLLPAEPPSQPQTNHEPINASSAKVALSLLEPF